MTIRVRILLGFAAPFLACLGLGLFALQQTSQLSAVIARFGGEWLPHVTVLGDVRAEIHQHHTYLLDHVIASNPADMQGLEAKLADEVGLIDGWFTGAARSFTTEQQHKLLDAAKTSWLATRRMSRQCSRHRAAATRRRPRRWPKARAAPRIRSLSTR